MHLSLSIKLPALMTEGELIYYYNKIVNICNRQLCLANKISIFTKSLLLLSVIINDILAKY